MITTHIRKQGGAAIMTIPASLLKTIDLPIGAEVVLDPVEHGFEVKVIEEGRRRRYTLKELLVGATPENIEKLNKQVAWSQEGDAMGQEII